MVSRLPTYQSSGGIEFISFMNGRGAENTEKRLRFKPLCASAVTHVTVLFLKTHLRFLYTNTIDCKSRYVALDGRGY